MSGTINAFWDEWAKVPRKRQIKNMAVIIKNLRGLDKYPAQQARLLNSYFEDIYSYAMSRNVKEIFNYSNEKRRTKTPSFQKTRAK